MPGCPIVTRVGGDSHVTVSGQALSSAGLGRQSYLTVSNVAGSLEDLEVNVEGKLAFIYHYSEHFNSLLDYITYTYIRRMCIKVLSSLLSHKNHYFHIDIVLHFVIVIPLNLILQPSVTR